MLVLKGPMELLLRQVIIINMSLWDLSTNGFLLILKYIKTLMLKF